MFIIWLAILFLCYLQVEKKERLKHKGPLDHVPSNTEEWSTYDAPEEALEAFKHKLMTSTGINDKTILKHVSVVINHFNSPVYLYGLC